MPEAAFSEMDSLVPQLKIVFYSCKIAGINLFWTPSEKPASGIINNTSNPPRHRRSFPVLWTSPTQV
jgi:hypothetical protein